MRRVLGEEGPDANVPLRGQLAWRPSMEEIEIEAGEEQRGAGCGIMPDSAAHQRACGATDGSLRRSQSGGDFQGRTTGGGALR